MIPKNLGCATRQAFGKLSEGSGAPGFDDPQDTDYSYSNSDLSRPDWRMMLWRVPRQGDCYARPRWHARSPPRHKQQELFALRCARWQLDTLRPVAAPWAGRAPARR